MGPVTDLTCFDSMTLFSHELGCPAMLSSMQSFYPSNSDNISHPFYHHSTKRPFDFILEQTNEASRGGRRLALEPWQFSVPEPPEDGMVSISVTNSGHHLCQDLLAEVAPHFCTCTKKWANPWRHGINRHGPAHMECVSKDKQKRLF
jgi:hypothetical protein